MYAQVDDPSTDPSNQNLVLICVDRCESSKRAFNWYLENFYRKDHSIGLVHVYMSPTEAIVDEHVGRIHTDKRRVSINHDKLLAQLQSSTAIIHEYEELCRERSIQCKVFNEKNDDSVGHTICQLAQEHHAKCIVMGQKGLGAIKRTIYGSVSDHVLHHSHVVVVVVPPPKVQKHGRRGSQTSRRMSLNGM